jgi:hypothetical protein
MAHTSQTKLVVEAGHIDGDEKNPGLVTLEVTSKGIVFQTSRGRAVEITDKDDLDAILDVVQEALDGSKEPEKAQRAGAAKATQPSA